MEQKNETFRLRLNLFDGIVLVLALAVGAFLLWNTLKPTTPSGAQATTSTVRYTVRFQRFIPGTGVLIEEGDVLVDGIKNFELGKVVSTEIVPAQALILNHQSKRLVLSTVPGYEDVLVTVESPCTSSDESLILGGGYTLRVGATAYVRGEGYMSSGPIVSIEREGQA